MEYRFDALGSAVELTVANDERFDSLNVDLNGTSAGDLSAGMRYVAPNGWHAVSFVIPASLFVYDGTSGAFWSNAIEIDCGFEGPLALNPDIRVTGNLTYVSE